METTFLQQQQQQQQKQYQPETISFHREEIPQLKVCMLNTQLTNLKVEFQAGKIKQCLCNWKHLTSDIEILQTVLGLPIELTDDLVQTHLHHCSQKHQLVIDDEIEKLLQKNMITRCDHEKEEIISPVFFKKENRWFIYILSLKSLNKSIETQHFKTETITSILTYWSHLICILLRLT